MVRILVTGGNGFLGLNIVQTLLKNGNELMVISRKEVKNVSFLKYSTGYSEHKNAILNFNPASIIHCAWSGGNNYTDINSLNQVQQNFQQGVELLEIAIALPTKPTFIGFGSFAEYGIITSPVNETSPELPISLYGATKLAFKQIAENICKTNALPFVWVRPCYVYGYGDVSTRLVPRLIDSFLRGESITLDSCDVIIDYIHIDDFCSAIYKIVVTKSTGIFNICSGEGSELKLLIEKIYKLIGANVNIVFDSSKDRTSISKYIVGDNSKLKKIGWTPSVSFENGIKQILDKRNEYSTSFKV